MPLRTEYIDDSDMAKFCCVLQLWIGRVEAMLCSAYCPHRSMPLSTEYLDDDDIAEVCYVQHLYFSRDKATHIFSMPTML